MPYDPNIHHRRSIRLAGYDYAGAGAYFVTICTTQRGHLFGSVQDGEMHMNAFGQIVDRCWYDLPNHYAYAMLDAFVVMPDHVHGIIVLENEDNGGNVVGAGLRPAPTGPAPTGPALNADRPMRAGLRPAPTGPAPTGPALNADRPMRAGLRPAPTASHQNRHGLPEIVRAFKSFSARRINHLRGTTGTPLWQRNYYEHVIRNEQEHDALRAYIVNNPARWDETR